MNMAKGTAVIEATLYWPNLATKNELSGKYQVDLANLGKDAIKTLEKLGVEVRTDPHKNEDYEDRGRFVVGKSKFPIKVIFKANVNEVDPEVIGNGTKAKVKLVTYDWTFGGGSGVGVGVNKIQVTDLVEYDSNDDDDFDDDDGDELSDELDDEFEAA
jgi:hypothetical protein